MNPTFEVLPVATRDTTAESAVFTRESPTEHPGAGAFVIDVQELAEGASLVVAIQRGDGAYVLASHPFDRPGTYTVAVGDGLGVHSPNVSAPGVVLPDTFRVAYVIRDGAVRFGVEASVI